MSDLVCRTEVYEFIGSCMDIYNTLGYGFSEVIYKDALELELQKKDLFFTREDELAVIYKGNILKHKFKTDYRNERYTY